MPATLAEATSLLVHLDGQSRVIAGGTDLLVMMKDRTISVQNIIDLKSVPGLDRIERDETGGLYIGALTRIADIARSAVIGENYPALRQGAEALGTPQVRNMATIGGNICRSSPSADMIPPLLVYDARLRLSGAGMERTVALEDFFTGPGGNILDSEVLTGIIIPPERLLCGSAYGKIGRLSEDLAKVNGAVKIIVSGGVCVDVRIALGAVAATPVRARKAEQELKKQKIDDRLIEDAAAKACEEISPIDDVRSTAGYRTRVSRVLIKRLLKQAIEKCGVN